MPEELSEYFLGLRERLAYEIQHGGSEEACPFCGLPRCKRSDYIRCSKCGLNWAGNEDLSIDPSVYRMRKERIGRLGTQSEVPQL